MIHSSRQIRTKADIYGGYSTERERMIESAESTRIVSDTPAAPVSSESIVMADAYREQAVDTSMYSTRETMGASQATEQAVDIPARPEHEKKALTREDLMPTIKTLRYNGDSQAEPEQSTQLSRKTKAAIDPKYKVMLTVYVTIALVLAIAVIVTGVYISGAQADAAAVSSLLSQKQAVILDQEATLASLLDEANIMEQAEANGMVKAEGAEFEVERVEKVEVPQTPELTKVLDIF